MKSTIFTLIPSMMLAMLMVLMMGSCSREQQVGPSPVQSDEVMFLIQVPGNPAPTTRSIADGQGDDNKITAVDILMFNAANDQYVRSVFCENITDDQAQMNLKVVKARLPKGDYKLVVIANSHAKVIAANIAVGTNLTTALNTLKYSLTNYGDPWNSIPGSTGYLDFPMWGQVTGTVTVPRAAGEKIEVDLVRMLAKINISVPYTETNSLKDFELTSVEVFNYNKEGRLVPDATNWASTPKKATELKTRESGEYPTSLKFDNTGSYHYIKSKATTLTTGEYYSLDDIFVFESAADLGAFSWEKNTCLVIGGKYKGILGYYRLDFIGTGKVRMDIVRNHKYNFEVVAIKTQGYPTPDEALKNVPENMEYTVTPWDESKVGDLLVDGTTQLTVSPSSKVSFFKNPATQSVDIYTNYKDGWQVQKLPADASKYRIVDADGEAIDWITVDHYGTTAPGQKKLEITVTDNTTALERTGYIYIKASRIEHRLTITQSTVPLIDLKITKDDKEISELVFPSGLYVGHDVVPQTIKLSWAPYDKGNPCNLLITPMGNYPFDFGTGTNLGIARPITNALGYENYANITPPAMLASEISDETFKEKSTLYSYTVFNGIQTMAKSLVVHQIHYNRTAPVEDVYLMDGSTYTINIKTNAAWKIELTSNPKDVVTRWDHLSGEYNLPAGQNFTFDLENDIANGAVKLQSDVVFTISSTDPTRYFDPYEVKVNALSAIPQGLANSYFLKTGSKVPIMIPVIRANGKIPPAGKLATDSDYLTSAPTDGVWLSALGTQIQTTDNASTLTPGIVWSDYSTELTSNGVIKKMQIIGTGNKAYILIFPGGKQGNAVIDITKGGTRLWSWHIWGTDYYPYTPAYDKPNPTVKGSGTNNYWMDRNLGALSNDITTVESYGLYYQHSRKDPYQRQGTYGDNTVNWSSAKKKQYDLNGEVSPTRGVALNGTASVRQPMAMSYITWRGTSDATTGQPVNLWGGQVGGTKTIFDPCPVGYRVVSRDRKSVV